PFVLLSIKEMISYLPSSRVMAVPPLPGVPSSGMNRTRTPSNFSVPSVTVPVTGTVRGCEPQPASSDKLIPVRPTIHQRNGRIVCKSPAKENSTILPERARHRQVRLIKFLIAQHPLQVS